MAREYATTHGIEVVETWTKAMQKGLLAVTPHDVAIGSIPFVHQRLRSSGAKPPLPNDYPESVREFLHREVTRTTLREARVDIDEYGKGLFVKPATKLKRFTGFVANFAYDHRFNGAGGRTEVWVSNPVNFVSEWRVYSVGGDVLAVGSAPSNPSDPSMPNRDVIDEIAQRLYEMPAGFAGLCFDVGVLDTGQTALVEVNEGYGFGAYEGCTPEALWAVNVARQRQIVAYGPV